MRSTYQHLAIDGTETRSFAAAVTENADYLTTSRYIRHIGAYLKHYDKKQLLVLTTERLESDPSETLQAVHSHISVERVEHDVDTARRNVTEERRVESTTSQRLKANRPTGGRSTDHGGDRCTTGCSPEPPCCRR